MNFFRDRATPDGELLDMRTYPAPRRDAIEGLALNADGTMVAVGYRDADQEELNSFIVDTGRAFVMKLDRDLGVIWERTIRGAMFQAFGRAVAPWPSDRRTQTRRCRKTHCRT